MSIRHKEKGVIDINQLLISLENPSQENVEELNLKLGKYLDKQTKLNLSFWQSITYNYWTYINLLKLADKEYDTNAEEFIKRIYQIVEESIRRSPTSRLVEEQQTIINQQVESDESSEEPENSTFNVKEWIPDVSVPKPIKYVAAGVLAIFVVGATLKFTKTSDT